MYIYVYVVCMFVCMYVYMGASMYLCKYIFMYVCMFILELNSLSAYRAPGSTSFVAECISNNNLSVSHCDVSSLSSFQPPAFLQLRTTDLLVPVGLPALYSCAADTEVSTEYKTSGSMPEH